MSEGRVRWRFLILGTAQTSVVAIAQQQTHALVALACLTHRLLRFYYVMGRRMTPQRRDPSLTHPACGNYQALPLPV